MTEPTIEDFRDSWACEHVRPEMTVDERREAFDRMIAQVRAETLRKAREAINTVRNVPSLIALADKFGGYHQGERAGLEKAEGVIARIEREGES